MFNIAFVSEHRRSEDLSRNKERLAAITVGRFVERFIVSTGFWSAADYENHWTNGVERSVAGALKSCLLTSVCDPQTANFVFCWALYRQGSVVYVQNKIIFLDQLMEPFDVGNPHESVSDRVTASEDGERVSEWSTTVAELENFLARIAESR